MRSSPSPSSLERLRRLLCQLQDTIRDAVLASRRKHAKHFASIAGVTQADTIYRIDRISEAAIIRWFRQNWPATLPVEVVMEGIEEGETVTFPQGTPVDETAWKCILDPIDGTRCIMHDKRSAWSLAAIAPQRGAATNLQDIVVAAMTELPTTKQSRSDQFSAVRGGKLVAKAKFPDEGRARPLRVRPSQATDFKHGFASFVRFFPAGRVLTSQLEDALWKELYGDESSETPIIFDDQYISTGGQLHELMSGRDRFVGDLRPLVFRALGQKHISLSCHPYDICTALLLEAAGGVVEAPDGSALEAPLDTVTPVAWVGYANPRLAVSVRPVLRKVLAKAGCLPSP